MKERFIHSVLIVIMVSCQVCLAQENNYWTQQVGSLSSIMGGAVTAGDRDNSAIYYNPGALAFIENSSLSVNGNTYFLSSLSIEDGAGENKELHSTIVDAVPQIISGILKSKKNPNISVNYAILNNKYSFIKMDQKHRAITDILPDFDGDELYLGDYSYYNRMKEDWAGIGYGRKISPFIGIGVSMFIAFHSQDYIRTNASDIINFIDVNSPIQTLAKSTYAETMEFRNIGLVWKIGLAYEQNNWRLGLNATLPKVNLGFISKASLDRSLYSFTSGRPDLNLNNFTIQSRVKSYHKTPLNLDAGIERIFNRGAVGIRLGYFSPVKTYAITDVSGPRDSLESIVRPADPLFSTFQKAHKSVINIGIGGLFQIVDGWAILGGFRTDFNHFDFKELPLHESYISSVSYWNLYHVSGGFTWYGDRFNLSIGFNYAFANDKNGPQLANLTEPSQENLYFGEPKNNAKVVYRQLDLNIGFTYLFPRL